MNAHDTNAREIGRPARGRLYGAADPDLARQGDRSHQRGLSQLIEASPFVALATSGPDGLDCSPRGDLPGFVRVRRRQDADDPGPPRQQPHRQLAQPDAATRASRCCSSFPAAARRCASMGRASVSVDPALRESFTVQWQGAARGADRRRSRRCSSSAPRRSCAPSCGTQRRRSTATSLPSAGKIIAASERRQARRRAVRQGRAGTN